jgi:hypothetical protein
MPGRPAEPADWLAKLQRRNAEWLAKTSEQRDAEIADALRHEAEHADELDRLNEQSVRRDAERSRSDRRRQARVAATSPGRLPLTGTWMRRRPGGPWRAADTGTLTARDRAALATYRRARIVHRLLPVRVSRPRSSRPRARRRTGASSSSSGSDPGGGDPDGDPEQGHRLTVARAGAPNRRRPRPPEAVSRAWSKQKQGASRPQPLGISSRERSLESTSESRADLEASRA